MSCYQESAVIVDEEEEEAVSVLGRELLIEKEIRFRDLEFFFSIDCLCISSWKR